MIRSGSYEVHLCIEPNAPTQAALRDAPDQTEAEVGGLAAAGDTTEADVGVLPPEAAPSAGMACPTGTSATAIKLTCLCALLLGVLGTAQLALTGILLSRSRS
jgi:hypothetical protein